MRMRSVRRNSMKSLVRRNARLDAILKNMYYMNKQNVLPDTKYCGNIRQKETYDGCDLRRLWEFGLYAGKLISRCSESVAHIWKALPSMRVMRWKGVDVRPNS